MYKCVCHSFSPNPTTRSTSQGQRLPVTHSLSPLEINYYGLGSRFSLMDSPEIATSQNPSSCPSWLLSPSIPPKSFHDSKSTTTGSLPFGVTPLHVTHSLGRPMRSWVLVLPSFLPMRSSVPSQESENPKPMKKDPVAHPRPESTHMLRWWVVFVLLTGPLVLPLIKLTTH